eukprot:363643-Chlamydomonas_euryale.AAC.13
MQLPLAPAHPCCHGDCATPSLPGSPPPPPPFAPPLSMAVSCVACLVVDCDSPPPWPPSRVRELGHHRRAREAQAGPARADCYHRVVEAGGDAALRLVQHLLQSWHRADAPAHLAIGPLRLYLAGLHADAAAYAAEARLPMTQSPSLGMRSVSRLRAARRRGAGD